MKTANLSNHPARRVLWALVWVTALAAAGCSSKVNFSPTAPEWPIPTPGNLGDRSLRIYGSLSAEQGTCLEATILYDGVELAGARKQCPDRAACAKLRLEGSTLTKNGHHTISFQVLEQSQQAVDYLAEGTVVVTRENLSLGGATLPLRPARATLRPGEAVTFEIDFTD